MAHEHCNKCFLVNCSDPSSCRVISCPNGCFAYMHECKRNDHENVCSNALIPCLNTNYGCQSLIRRFDLSRHLRICPASVTVCSFIYNHDFDINYVDNSMNKNLIELIAHRDNIWFDHVQAFQRQQAEFYSDYQHAKPNHQVENVIRSTKYRYITMPECMLSKTDGVICSTCRKHLRQLEENEDERYSLLSEEERKIMMDFNSNYNNSSDQISSPSLVKMSSTLINVADISEDSLPSTTQLSTSTTDIEPMPSISDMDLPSSFIYRLKFFSSGEHEENVKSFNKSPRFYCHALCRRDEIEQHWLTHFHVDCILNKTLIQQCPKSQYGCNFQYERLEPCQNHGQAIQIRFDRLNDAVAFDWYPNIEYISGNVSLIDLPTEILAKIFEKLDSLSLRNVSVVCRRLRALCEKLLPSRGIVVIEHERDVLSHGDVTWIERKKHWLFTNTAFAAPKWQLKEANKSTSLNQHLITCPYGEKKDLINEKPFALPIWSKNEITLKTLNS